MEELKNLIMEAYAYQKVVNNWKNPSNNQKKTIEYINKVIDEMERNLKDFDPTFSIKNEYQKNQARVNDIQNRIKNKGARGFKEDAFKEIEQKFKVEIERIKEEKRKEEEPIKPEPTATETAIDNIKKQLEASAQRLKDARDAGAYEQVASEMSYRQGLLSKLQELEGKGKKEEPIKNEEPADKKETVDKNKVADKAGVPDKAGTKSEPDNRNVVKFATYREQQESEQEKALANPNIFRKFWNKVEEGAKKIIGFVTDMANRIFKGKKKQAYITTTPKEKIGKNNFKDELKLDYNQMEQETNKQYDHAMSEIRKEFSDERAQGTLENYKRTLAQKTTTDLQFDYNIDYTAAAKIFASDRLNEWRQGFRQESINELFELPIGTDGKPLDYTIRPDTNLKPEKIEDLSKLSIEDIQKNYFLTKAEARGIFENENVKAKRVENKGKTKEDEENQK